MADVVVRGETPNFVGRVRRYLSDVAAEMRRVTWPDIGQVKQLSIGVIVLALAIGGVIAIIDVILQNVLVSWIPSIFRG